MNDKTETQVPAGELKAVDISLFERIMQLGAQVGGPVTGIDGKQYLPQLDSGILKYMPITDPTPTRIKEHLEFTRSDSFCAYINEYKNLLDSRTAIFASLKDQRFHAALDWHSATASPQTRTHNAYFSPRLDSQFEKWLAVNGKLMDQNIFVEFLEEHAPEIIEPDAASMLEIATDLNVKVDITYKSKKSVSNNMVQLEYREKAGDVATGTGNILLPSEIAVRVPLFFGEEAKDLKIFLRLHLRQGEPIRFKLDIHRLDSMLEEAFLAIASRIAENTHIVPMSGGVSA